MGRVHGRSISQSRWSDRVLHGFERLFKPVAARQVSQAAPQAFAQADLEPSISHPLRVLVADDCPVNQTISVALLGNLDITPLLAGDGAEAVALACGQEFDLILMDLQMPILDGVRATAQIRRFERQHSLPRVPVVAYTSSASSGDEDFLRDFGIDAVLEKPCNVKALRNCLLRWCPARSASLSGPSRTQAIAAREALALQSAP